MKFRLIKEDCVNVGAYGYADLSTGDVIELEGYLADKADANPDFKKVVPRTKKAK